MVYDDIRKTDYYQKIYNQALKKVQRRKKQEEEARKKGNQTEGSSFEQATENETIPALEEQPANKQEEIPTVSSHMDFAIDESQLWGENFNPTYEENLATLESMKTPAQIAQEKAEQARQEMNASYRGSNQYGSRGATGTGDTRTNDEKRRGVSISEANGTAEAYREAKAEADRLQKEEDAQAEKVKEQREAQLAKNPENPEYWREKWQAERQNIASARKNGADEEQIAAMEANREEYYQKYMELSGQETVKRSEEQARQKAEDEEGELEEGELSEQSITPEKTQLEQAQEELNKARQELVRYATSSGGVFDSEEYQHVIDTVQTLQTRVEDLRKQAQQEAQDSLSWGMLYELAQPGRKMTAAEEEVVRDALETWNGTVGPDLDVYYETARRLHELGQSTEEVERLLMQTQIMDTLATKLSGVRSAFSGAGNALPLVPQIRESLEDSNWENAGFEGANPLGLSERSESAQTQNPLAYGAGYMGSMLGQYALGSAAMKAIPGVGSALGRAGERLASTGAAQALQRIPVLGQVATQEALTGMLGDALLDLGLDTAPTVLRLLDEYNRQQREGLAPGEEALTIGDILKEAGINIATNAGFNVAGELAPAAMRALSDLFHGRPVMSAAQSAALDKMAQGLKLTDTEQRMVDNLTEAYPDYVQQREFLPLEAEDPVILDDVLRQEEQGSVNELARAYRAGTLTNAQMETLKPGGVNRAAFEQATGVKLPETSSETRRVLREGLDNGQRVAYSETMSSTGGAQNEFTGAERVRSLGEDALPMGQGMGFADGGGGNPADGDSVLRGFLSPTENINNAVARTGATPLELRDTTSEPQLFSSALEQARQNNPHGLMVSGKSVEELTQPGTVTFMSRDGLAGALVTADGDIEAVFKNPQSGAKGAGSSLLLNAVNNGGTKLDCYGDRLVNLYAKHGFEPVARVPWNPEYAPAGWTYGPQDVFVMKLADGVGIDDITARLGISEADGGFHRWTREELDALPVMDYDAALAYRDELIEIGKTNAELQIPRMQIGTAQNAIPAVMDDDFLNSTDGGIGIGAARARFNRTEVPTRDLANQRSIVDGLDEERIWDLGPQNTRTHTRYTDAEAMQDAMDNVEISIQQAEGDVRQGLMDEMNRLRQTGDGASWNKTDVKTAQAIQQRLKDEWKGVEPGTDDYVLLQSLYNDWNNEIANHATEAGQGLQAFRQADFSIETVNQKISRYIKAKADRWAKSKPKAAENLKGLSQDIDVIAGDWDSLMREYNIGTQGRDSLAGGMEEISRGVQPAKPTPLEVAQQKIQRLAQKRRVELTDAQVKSLAADLLNGKGQTAYYDKLLQFASDVEELDLETIEQIDNILSQAEKMTDSRARSELESQVYSILVDKLGANATAKEKIDAWRYLAMLGNTRTHVRNMVGNVMMDGIVRIKDGVAVGLERFLPKEERTHALLNPANARDRALRGAAYQYAENNAFSSLTGGSSRFNVQRGIEGEKDIFNTGWLEALRRGNNAALEGEDFKGAIGVLDAFRNTDGPVGNLSRHILESFDKAGAKGFPLLGGIQNNYASAAAQFLKARGYDASIFTKGDMASKAVLSEMHKVATESAMRSTFHEYSKMAEFLSKAQRSGGIVGTITDSIMPFKQTPINVFKQGIRYSPVGFVNGLRKLVTHAISGKYTGNQIINSLAEGLTGTSLMALGGFLAANGWLNGSASSEESKWKSAQGQQDYSVTLPGGGTYTIDWAAPVSIPLLAGAEAYKAWDENGFDLSQFLDALSNMGEPILETTMLSGINGVLQDVQYSDKEDSFAALSSIASQAAENYVSQFIPTLSGQMARTIDPMRRDYYGGGQSATARNISYAADTYRNKIPFLSMTNDPYVDVWGREQENAGGNPFGRFIMNTLSPGYYSPNQTTEVDEQLQALYDETGNGDILPNTAEKHIKLGGEDYYFTSEEYHDYSQIRGQKAEQFIDELMDDPGFNELSADEQAEIIPDLYTLAGDIAALEVKEGYTKNTKLFKVWQEDGDDAVIPYLLTEKYAGDTREEKGANTLSNAELYDVVYNVPGLSDEEYAQNYLYRVSGKEKAQEAYDYGGADFLQEYAYAKATADTNHNNSLTNKERRAAIDKMSGLTNEQKSFMWYLLGGKNPSNPYD